MKQHTSELNRVLGQIEAQILHLNQTLKELKTTLQKLSDRVSSIELYFSFWRGGLGAILLMGSLLSFIVQWCLTQWSVGQ
ncbi:MAG: hypothetical protein ABFQ95_06040 [Pseudomonadota bacterium]